MTVAFNMRWSYVPSVASSGSPNMESELGVSGKYSGTDVWLSVKYTPPVEDRFSPCCGLVVSGNTVTYIRSGPHLLPLPHPVRGHCRRVRFLWASFRPGPPALHVPLEAPAGNTDIAEPLHCCLISSFPCFLQHRDFANHNANKHFPHPTNLHQLSHRKLRPAKKFDLLPLQPAIFYPSHHHPSTAPFSDPQDGFLHQAPDRPQEARQASLHPACQRR